MHDWIILFCTQPDKGGVSTEMDQSHRSVRILVDLQESKSTTRGSAGLSFYIYLDIILGKFDQIILTQV